MQLLSIWPKPVLRFAGSRKNSSWPLTQMLSSSILSVGQQQRVELLKALYRHARLLILDEPTAVLTPQEVEEFFCHPAQNAGAGKDGRHNHPQAG